MPTDYSLKYLSDNQKIYQKYIDEITRLTNNVKDDNFIYSRYPTINKKVNSILQRMYDDLKLVIVTGIGFAWLESNKSNDKLVNSVVGKSGNPKYYDQNDAALKSFQSSKDITDSLTRTIRQFKQEIELSVAIGLKTGLSTNEIDKSVKSYLNKPDTLFKKAKEAEINKKYGKLVNPGQVIYRSSYKNTQRIISEQVNNAYRVSDYERRQNLDFVRGIEVSLSPDHSIQDICDHMVGFYPKDFMFIGWHPRCFCLSTSVLLTPDEFNQTQELLLSGQDINVPSKNDVKSLPIGFTDWVRDNKDKIDRAKHLPYFLKYNPKYYKK
jgi:hypothetical protein